MTDVIRMRRPTPEQALETLSNFSGLIALLNDAFAAVKDVQANQDQVEALKKEIADLTAQRDGAKGDIDKAKAAFKKLQADQADQAAKQQEQLKADYDAASKVLADQMFGLQSQVDYWKGVAKDAEAAAKEALVNNQTTKAELQKDLDAMTLEAESKVKVAEDRVATAQKKLDDLKGRIQKMADI